MSILQLSNGFKAVGITDCGLKRERNEDSYGLDAELGLLLLADGMGGYTRGDIASNEAVKRFTAFIQTLTIEPEPSFWHKIRHSLYTRPQRNAQQLQLAEYAEQLVRDLLQATHNDIEQLNLMYPPGSGVMGTTFVGLWMWSKLPEHVMVFHAGDSRAYRYRNGQIEQLTNDHSLFQQWLDDGSVGQQPAKNVVLQALGAVAELQPDVSLQLLENDDRLLLCSDGLTGMVDDMFLEQVMAQLTAINLQQSCQDLIDQANANGGVDNVTVILACHK